MALAGTVAAGGQISMNVDFPVPSDGDLYLYLADAELTVLDAVKLEPRDARVSVDPAVADHRKRMVSRGHRHARRPERAGNPHSSSSTKSCSVRRRRIRPANSWKSINRGAHCGQPEPAGEFAEGINYTFPAGAMLARRRITRSWPGIRPT